MSVRSLRARTERLIAASFPKCLSYLVTGDDADAFDPRNHVCRRCGRCHATVIMEVVVMPDGTEIPATEYRRRRDAEDRTA